jgi:hypothetical protein
MYNQNFESAKNKIIREAERQAMGYLSSKYGVAKLTKGSQVELTHVDGPISNTFDFTGKIRCFASTPVLEGYSDVGLDLTVNNNDVSVESESTVGDNIIKALNSSEDYLPSEDVVTANLKDFRLIDSGDNKYLKVAHPALEDAEIGIVGRNEYETSPNKAELLKSIVSDSIVRTASYNYSIQFTGEFKNPVIEKYADIKPTEKITKTAEFPGGPCKGCGKDLPLVWGETYCKECVDKGLASPAKKSWLGDLEAPMENDHQHNLGRIDELGKAHCVECDKTEEEIANESNPVSISENMPRASMADTLQQSMQAEQQKLAAEKDKLSNQAVNQLIPTLQSLGFGSARVSEVTPNLSHSDSGFDGEITAMTFLEDKTSTKLVAFPIKIKSSQIELPKFPLLRELVEKAININEKLTEQLTKEALLSLASVDEKVTYEANEVKAILEDKIEKVATENASSGTQFMPESETMTLQKHLLPGDLSESMEIGQEIFADGQYWKLVSKDSSQNSKGSNDGSLWKFIKCEAPKGDKEPTTVIPQ